MNNIIKSLTLALSLGIAPVGLVYAQTDVLRPPAAEQQPDASVEGEAGAAVEEQTDTSAEESGTAVAPSAEEETGVTAEGEADAATDEETGTAEAPAQEDETDAAEGEATTDDAAGTAEAPAAEGGTEATAEGEAEDETAVDTGAPSMEVTGSIDVTTEQRTELTRVVREIDVDPVDVDFDIDVGIAIPTTSRVALYVVPDPIFTVVPQFRGHLHFVAADRRVVIVDPCTLQVVAVIA